MPNIDYQMSTNTKKEKLSAIFLRYASDYIAMGETAVERQGYLNSAVKAWNISLLSGSAQKQAIDEYVNLYERANPDANDSASLRENVLLLIAKKSAQFGHIKRTIFSAQLTNQNGRDHLTVVSIGEEK